MHAIAFCWLWQRTNWQLEAVKAAERAEVKLELTDLVEGTHERGGEALSAEDNEGAALLAQDGWRDSAHEVALPWESATVSQPKS